MIFSSTLNTPLLHLGDASFKAAWQLIVCILLFTFCLHISTGYAWASNSACVVHKPAQVAKSDNTWIFELVTICQHPAINTVGLIDRYIAHIQTRDTITVVESNDVSTDDERRTSVIAIVENLQTAHGDMRIEADISVSGGGSDKTLAYSQVSNRINATGASALTRKVIEIVNVSQDAQGFQVTIKKVLHMKKPWYAPSGIFKKEVYKGLARDLQLVTDRHFVVLLADSLGSGQ